MVHLAHDIFDTFLRLLTFLLGITLLALSILPPLIASHRNHGVKSQNNVPCGVNLLENPSFETNSMRGHDVTPWVAHGQLSSWRATNEHASRGENSLRLWTKDAVWVSQHFDHEEGVYTGGVSILWAPESQAAPSSSSEEKATTEKDGKKKKHKSPSLEKKEKCKIVIRNSGRIVFEKPKDAQPGKWRRYGFQFTSNELMQIRIGKGNFELGLVCTGLNRGMMDEGDAHDVYYFDDVVVKKECKKHTHDEL